MGEEDGGVEGKQKVYEKNSGLHSEIIEYILSSNWKEDMILPLSNLLLDLHQIVSKVQWEGYQKKVWKI